MFLRTFCWIYALSDKRGAAQHEVIEVAMSFLDEAASTRLVKKALAGGVHFTAEGVVGVLEYIKEDFIPTLVFAATTKYTEGQEECVSCFLSDADYKRLCREDSVRYSKPAAKKRKHKIPNASRRCSSPCCEHPKTRKVSHTSTAAAVKGIAPSVRHTTVTATADGITVITMYTAASWWK